MRRALVVAVLLVLPISACARPSRPSTAGTTASSAVSPVPSATSPTVPPTSAAAAPTGAPTSAAAFRYLPLWPFGSVNEAEAWQRAANPGGHQPWHLDTTEVALMFTRQYLGFTEVDRVVSTTVSGDEARVAVGFATGTAAVIHLARIGASALGARPWEVVGTDDAATFTITAPAYGSRVSSPVTVGGHISGVDESIRITIRHGSAVAGTFCCLAAGGGAAGQSWSTPVRFAAAPADVLAIVASTGGHLRAVERFAVTGARAS